MERKGNYFLVGLFIVIALAGVLFFTVWIKGSDDDDGRRYTIYFNESVNGLNKGGPIKYRGVQVGQVENLGIDPKISTRIVVTARIKTSAPVHQGTVATLKNQGITGAIYIDLTNTREKAPPIEPLDDETFPVIPSVTSDLQKAVENASDTIAKLNVVADRAKLLFSDQNIANFSAALENLQQTSEILARNDEKIQRLLDDTGKAMQSISELSAQVNVIVRESKPGIEQFTTEGLQQTGQLITESRETMRDIGTLSKELKENPSQIIFPKKHKGRPIE